MYCVPIGLSLTAGATAANARRVATRPRNQVTERIVAVAVRMDLKKFEVSRIGFKRFQEGHSVECRCLEGRNSGETRSSCWFVKYRIPRGHGPEGDDRWRLRMQGGG